MSCGGDMRKSKFLVAFGTLVVITQASSALSVISTWSISGQHVYSQVSLNFVCFSYVAIAAHTAANTACGTAAQAFSALGRPVPSCHQSAVHRA